jgi:hypothetical protein
MLPDVERPSLVLSIFTVEPIMFATGCQRNRSEAKSAPRTPFNASANIMQYNNV